MNGLVILCVLSQFDVAVNSHRQLAPNLSSISKLGMRESIKCGDFKPNGEKKVFLGRTNSPLFARCSQVPHEVL